jgi:hypothetical protein
MSDDFELVKGTRNAEVGKAVKDAIGGLDDVSKGKLVNAVAGSMPEIIKLAGQVVDIRKIYAESDKQVAEIEAKTDALRVETENYVKRVEAETNKTLSKTEQYRLLLNDFYKNNNGAMSGEVFADIMKTIILDSKE